jgi:hypothetical protein
MRKGTVALGRSKVAPAVVTQALGQYTTDILDLAEESNKVFGKVRYHGDQSERAARRCADWDASLVVWRPDVHLRGWQGARPCAW